MSARPRVAFLTGQSDPGRGALSPVQRAALDALADGNDGIDFDPHQFPWDSAAGAWRPVPLLRASLANGRQYLGARRGMLHGASSAQCVAARQRLLSAPRTLLLVGSCGLVLFDTLIAPLDDADRARLRVVAYGAVAPRWPRGIDGVQLRGDRDRIAAWLGPVDGPALQPIAAGHMDYLDGEPSRNAVIAAARAQLDWLRGA
ncbi:MAG: hypothetical protein V4673_04765 [Pseudomonadota bacterium]